MKDILVQHYSITDFIAGSPREVVRKSYQAEIVCSEVRMEMLKVRNSLAHDYDGEIIKQHCRRIVDVYIINFICCGIQ